MSAKQTAPIVISSGTISSRPWEGFQGIDGGMVEWKTLLSAGQTNSDTFSKRYRKM
jgi:hypothetical protein